MLLALLLNLKQPSEDVASVARGGSDFIFPMASLPPRGTLEPDTNVPKDEPANQLNIHTGQKQSAQHGIDNILGY